MVLWHHRFTLCISSDSLVSANMWKVIAKPGDLLRRWFHQVIGSPFHTACFTFSFPVLMMSILAKMTNSFVILARTLTVSLSAFVKCSHPVFVFISCSKCGSYPPESCLFSLIGNVGAFMGKILPEINQAKKRGDEAMCALPGSLFVS